MDSNHPNYELFQSVLFYLVGVNKNMQEKATYELFNYLISNNNNILAELTLLLKSLATEWISLKTPPTIEQISNLISALNSVTNQLNCIELGKDLSAHIKKMKGFVLYLKAQNFKDEKLERYNKVLAHFSTLEAIEKDPKENKYNDFEVMKECSENTSNLLILSKKFYYLSHPLIRVFIEHSHIFETKINEIILMNFMRNRIFQFSCAANSFMTEMIQLTEQGCEPKGQNLNVQSPFKKLPNFI